MERVASAERREGGRIRLPGKGAGGTKADHGREEWDACAAGCLGDIRTLMLSSVDDELEHLGFLREIRRALGLNVEDGTLRFGKLRLIQKSRDRSPRPWDQGSWPPRSVTPHFL